MPRANLYMRSASGPGSISPAVTSASNGATTGYHLEPNEYDYHRQAYVSNGAAASLSRGSYSNGTYTNGPDAVFQSHQHTDYPEGWNDSRRPSWDASSIAQPSSVSSPASSVLGLGLPRVGGSGSSAGSGPSNGLMLLQSPDPLSPFFRSVQERNLVGNFSSYSPSPFSSSASSSFAPLSNASLSPDSPPSLSPLGAPRPPNVAVTAAYKPPSPSMRPLTLDAPSSLYEHCHPDLEDPQSQWYMPQEHHHNHNSRLVPFMTTESTSQYQTGNAYS